MKLTLRSLLQRGLEWSAHVQARLNASSRQATAQATEPGPASPAEPEPVRGSAEPAERQSVPDQAEALRFEDVVISQLQVRFSGLNTLGAGYRVLLSHRGADLLVHLASPVDPMLESLGWADPAATVGRVIEGEVRGAVLIVPDPGEGYVPARCDELVEAIRTMPDAAIAWATARTPEPSGAEADPGASAPEPILRRVRGDLGRLDFHALGTRMAVERPATIEPFDRPADLPPALPATPRRHAAIFLHNSYYHFNCLAAGLRKRGWDVLTVSVEAPDSPQRRFYHGEDLNLFDPDPREMSRKTAELFRTIPERFGSLHFYGQGHASLFPSNFIRSAEDPAVPWDFLELRRHRTIIGYMPSGCLDGGLQSSIRSITDGLCGRCVWELRPDVCSDAKNGSWNRTLDLVCDWIGLEGDYATPERVGGKTVYGPVVTALDPERWHPSLQIPEDLVIPREEGEVIVYHAVGNYELRRTQGRDLKGTGAIIAAVDTLRNEGMSVRLAFFHDIPSTKIRFLQAQADIVVDQVNYGRYGANARESMMLGLATVCCLNPVQAPPLPRLRPILEAPLAHADEASVVDVLRRLVADVGLRTELGRRARRFAYAWHGQDACAERYERVIERVRARLPADAPELYPLQGVNDGAARAGQQHTVGDGTTSTGRALA